VTLRWHLLQRESFTRAPPQLARKSRLKMRICLGDSWQDQIQRVTGWLCRTRVTAVKSQGNLSESINFFLQRLRLALSPTGLQPARSPTPPAPGQWGPGTSGHAQPPSAEAKLGSSSFCRSAPARDGALLCSPAAATAVLLRRERTGRGREADSNSRLCLHYVLQNTDCRCNSELCLRKYFLKY